MLEIPESITIARQLDETVQGKIISYVEANHSPHSFAFYSDHPEGYDDLLSGKRIGKSFSRGAMVEIEAEDCRVLIGDGAALRYYEDRRKVPKKHQLLIEFDDETALAATIQMYGCLYAFQEGSNDNPYYLVTLEKPFPLTEAFDEAYFQGLCTQETGKLSAKAFLATQQRIPGLGNGALQDILFRAEIHPKRKMDSLSQEDILRLFHSVKDTLTEMTEKGGRDTEKDLFGNPGGYQTILSRKTLTEPCPVCGHDIHKASYLGGTIYFCESCQRL